MANVLIVNDDIAARALVQLHLETGGHTVSLARDGADALRRLANWRPDVVVANVNLPEVDGVGLLQAMRLNPKLVDLPVILISGAGDEDLVRQCMLLGAYEFLSQPVMRQPLLDAVAAHLQRTAAAGADPSAARRSQQRQPAAGKFENTMRFGAVDPGGAHGSGTQSLVQGSVLFVDIRNFTGIAEVLAAHEVVELLDAFFHEACDPVRHQGGWIVKFLGDGFVALFEATPIEAEAADHAERALKAALLIVLAAHRFGAWTAKRFAGRTLPGFAAGIGVHSGEVVVWRMGSNDVAETTVIGDTVNVAARLESLTKELGWSICISRACADRAGARFVRGAARATELKGKAQPVEVVELTGLAPRAAATQAERQAYLSLADAVSANAALFRRPALTAVPAHQ